MGGAVDNVNVPIQSTALGGRATLDASGWTINRFAKQDPLTEMISSVPWWVWAAGLGAVGFWYLRKRRGRGG